MGCDSIEINLVAFFVVDVVVVVIAIVVNVDVVLDAKNLPLKVKIWSVI